MIKGIEAMNLTEQGVVPEKGWSVRKEMERLYFN